MTLNVYAKSLASAVIVATTILLSGSAFATQIKFSDDDTLNAFVDGSTEPDPGCRNVLEGSGELCVVRLTNVVKNPPEEGQRFDAFWTIFEPTAGDADSGITLPSDVVLFSIPSQASFLDVFFYSDPLPSIFQSGAYAGSVENGSLQSVLFLPPGLEDNLNIPLTVLFQSDVCGGDPVPAPQGLAFQAPATCPVPEPSSFVLLASATLALLVLGTGARARPWLFAARWQPFRSQIS